MKTTGNTLLITGGGTGIGRGLAEAFHQRGNTVIVAGRTLASLQAVTSANPGMHACTLDVGSPDDVQRVAQKLISDFPRLNGVIHSAGIMKPEGLLKQGSDLAIAEATVATNLLGTMRLTGALLSHFVAQPSATIMTVTSGLAFMPLALTPTYSATKAAVHSYSQSLRFQLRKTGVQVLELAPPYVRTGLMGERQANDPDAMPLDEFIREVMSILEKEPTPEEILVERVKPLRFAEQGDYQKQFMSYNERREQAK